MNKVIARLAALAAGLFTLTFGSAAHAAQEGREWQAPSPIPEAFVAYNAGDFAEALRIWQAACDAGNPQGCYHAAIVHRDGEGVPVDPAKANERFEQACEGGVGNACFNLGINASGKAQIAYFLIGCGYDNVGSCARLGMAYSTGDGVIQDNGKAVEYLSRACEVREMFAGPACFMLASLFDVHADEMIEDDPAKANHWLELGCRRGDLDSCQNLAWHYAHGFGLDTDFMRSAALYQFACGDNAGLECMFIPSAHRASGEYRGREIARRWRGRRGI